MKKQYVKPQMEAVIINGMQLSKASDGGSDHQWYATHEYRQQRTQRQRQRIQIGCLWRQRRCPQPWLRLGRRGVKK